MIRITQLKLSIDHSKEELIHKIQKALRLKTPSFTYKIVKQSLDCRHKEDKKFVYTIDVSLQEKNAEALHAALRAVDYVRYHNFPKGYMMRISSVKEREPVRVSKQAIADGMTFSHIGSEMINAYRKRKEVEAVQIYFLTSKTADYELLYDKAHRIEQITDSLNHMFNGLVMDCSACKSRELCDEIDGMKELHKNLSSI